MKPEELKRLFGVKPETFDQMVKLVENHEEFKKKTGRPSKLSIENQVLMTLEYLREYRTYFHSRKIFSLRFNWIAAIYNYELSLSQN